MQPFRSTFAYEKMNLKSISDIFPDYYENAPEEELLRKHCYAYMENATMPRDLYDWIDRKDCPYLREAYATVMLMMIVERNEDEEQRMNYTMRLEVEQALEKIICYAQTDQLAQSILYTAPLPVNNPATDNATLSQHVQQITHHLANLTKRVDYLYDQQLQDNFQWLFYTAAATEADKRVFEKQLTKLCQLKHRGMSADIKLYLRLKEETGLIRLPKSLTSEYEAVKEFGYPYSYQAYQGA